MTAGAPAVGVQVQGMSLACPQGWQDKSMLVLSAERFGPTGVSPSLVVTRETWPDNLPSETTAGLEAFVDRQVEQMRSALPKFLEVSRRRAGHGSAFAELKIDWVSEGIPITQWIVYSRIAEATLAIVTATAGQRDFTDAAPAFRSILQGLRFT